MNLNPYQTPGYEDETCESKALCVRRLDIALIAMGLVVFFLTSLAAIGLPSVRQWFMPRFGTSSSLVLFPLNFLLLYLWKPAPRMLAMASLMFFVVAALSAAVIFWRGTVSVVENSFNDLLPSAYAWSVLSLMILGAYIGYVAWVIRHHQAADASASQNAT